MVDMFACISLQTCARDCTLLDCYNALDDPVYWENLKKLNLKFLENLNLKFKKKFEFKIFKKI